MQTYLQIVASDLYRRFEGRFENVTVLFPNKRASLFFNQHLYEQVNQALWAPQYTNISEMFQSLSTLTLADPIQLVCMLHKAYCEVSGYAKGETLDQFWSWGELMLSDFDDIDSNRVDASKLFINIKDIDDLTNTDYLTEKQIEAITRFFPNFKESTELKERFLNIWNLLLPTYERFREILTEEGIAYGGMMKRQVIDDLAKDASVIDGRKIYAIVGFNVLNETERMLFRYLKENADTLFYWDYDTLYMEKEAGRFIKENIERFGNDLPDKEIYDNFSKPKQIHIISSPTENAQTRHVGKLLKEMPNHGANTDTAVVLCNESLLQPMLHAIPEGSEVNITMGFPMADTPISSLLLTLMELQMRGLASKADEQTIYWRYANAASILKHPYTLLMTGNKCAQLLNKLKDDHILFPTSEFFDGSDYLRTVFTLCPDVEHLLTWLLNITEQIGRKLRDDALGTESVFNAYTLLSRLKRIHEQGLLNIEPITLQRLLQQIIKGKAIPFHGEPAVGLQVMGILETRNLDFRNVFMLSVNEGKLPKTTNMSSFIPYNLREAYGMTTIERQNSLYAYYFYRLLQRAENIWLYYNNSTDGAARGEMSRYMMQLLTSNHFTTIQQQNLTADYTPQKSLLKQVTKTHEIIERLKIRFGEKGYLSASAINTYLNCPLKFYLNYVARLRTDDELTEEVGNDTFGNIFHYCMDHIYKDCIGLNREVQGNELTTIAGDKTFIENLVDEAFQVEFFKQPEEKKKLHPRYNGEQLLNREALITYVQDQLNFDATLCPLKVIDTEYHIPSFTLETSKYKVQLGGIIDRIDNVTLEGNRQLRIVDYKTSSNAQSTNTIEALFQIQKSKRAYHILQTLYYTDIYTRLHSDTPIAPSMMYVKKARTNDNQTVNNVITLGTSKDKTPVTDFTNQCRDEFHQRLTDTIDEIFNPDVSFSQNLSSDTCKYCDFAQFCGQTVKKE